MENTNEFKVSFGKFAEKIVAELKLADPQKWRISARMMDGIMMMQDWQKITDRDKQVEVFLRIHYDLHNGDNSEIVDDKDLVGRGKSLLFVQSYRLGDIVEQMDKNGVIACAEYLPLDEKKFELGDKYPFVKSNNCNHVKKANGEDCDLKELTSSVIKKCEEESKWFKPACVVENNNFGKNGGK